MSTIFGNNGSVYLFFLFVFFKTFIRVIYHKSLSHTHTHTSTAGVSQHD